MLASVSLPIDMDETKAEFCKAQQKSLEAVDFDEIYNHLMIGSQKAILTFKKIHLSFYCMLCDYKAHNEFNLQGGRDQARRSSTTASRAPSKWWTTRSTWRR